MRRGFPVSPSPGPCGDGGAHGEVAAKVRYGGDFDAVLQHRLLDVVVAVIGDGVDGLRETRERPRQRRLELRPVGLLRRRWRSCGQRLAAASPGQAPCQPHQHVPAQRHVIKRNSSQLQCVTNL